ncbi:MAG: Molybdopterin molybdenumtransferase [Verrucomicrobiota bacterium]
MEIEIQLTNSPIPSQVPPPMAEHGAWVEFRGVVRGTENGAGIAALEYEAYAPMAEKEIRRLLSEISTAQPCIAARVIHRLGVIPVGETAIYVGVAGKHRAEAFALVTEFMDRLKQDVPIWKRRAIPLTACADPTPANASIVTHTQPATVDETIALIHECCTAIEPEGVPLTEARGRTLREPVVAPEDQPPFDRSSVDGFAVRLDDPSKSFRIVDRIRAGDWKPRKLQAGEAVQIATGGALPSDGLQVVMKEDVRVTGDTLHIEERDRERNIRFRGEDACAGSELVGVGTKLSSGALALLASIGHTQPLVTRRPRVLHVATGNEIVSPEQTPQIGQIRDSNTSLVRAFMQSRGITPRQIRVGEDRAAIDSALRAPHSAFDLLLISGGASVGEHDFTRALLADLGYTLRISRTTTRPGKPLIFATRGNAVAFGLPGNPLAHFVCLNLYVSAALLGLSGGLEQSGFMTGELADDFASEANARETLWPARLNFIAGTAQLTLLPWRSSGDLTSLATANALVRIRSGCGKLTRGTRLDFVSTEP